MKNKHDKYIHSKNLLTIEEYDSKIEFLEGDPNNKILEKADIPTNTIVMSGIGCPSCGFRLIDGNETETDQDGYKFRSCGCFRCGSKIWRKILV